MAVGNQFSTVAKVLCAQALVALLFAVGFGGWSGLEAAKSSLLGGAVAWLPNLYFGYRIYLARLRNAQGVLGAFYSGETIKLILTAALFVMVLQIPAVDFLVLLVTYIAVLSVFWFALFFWRD